MNSSAVTIFSIQFYILLCHNFIYGRWTIVMNMVSYFTPFSAVALQRIDEAKLEIVFLYVRREYSLWISIFVCKSSKKRKTNNGEN